MGSEPKGQRAKGSGNSREDRLKAALKANLQRRKAQARARKDADTNKTGSESGAQK